jgi:hypothetical protein
LWWVAAAVLVLVLWRFGGAAVLGFTAALVRFLIPLGILVLIGMVIYWVGQRQGFWR